MSKIFKKEHFILAIILVLGLSLRLYHLDTYSIFFDEKSTMVVSQGMVLDGSDQKEIYLAPTFTPKQFWADKTLADYYNAMTRSDIGNSSFYYLLLHYWLEMFGLSDFSARLFSVLFSMVIIGMTYLFGKRFFSSTTGLVAAGLVAIEPFFIAYAQQARTYSLTFFLTLTATYFFLQIIEDKADKRKTFLLYIGYILTGGLGLLAHFLTISVLLAHGFYALFFLRSLKGWIRMAIAAVFTLSGLAWWLLFAGGQWTLFSLNEQAKLYKQMADTNGQAFGDILPATIPNVFMKSVPIFSELIILTNGLATALLGKRNVFIAIGVGLVLILWYRNRKRFKAPDLLVQAFPYVLLAFSLLIYNNHPFQFCILSVSIFSLSFVYDLHLAADTTRRPRLWLLYIMALVPTLFLILMSFKNGHTYGIMQRYSGFSFPYVIILMALLFQHILTLPATVRTLIFLFVAIQGFFITVRLSELYQDRSVSYGYLGEPRKGKNPFQLAAKKIIETYQPGDTVVYPAKLNVVLTEMDRNFSPYRMRDAQLTNLYLPKDAEFIQRVDTTERDRILIRRKKETLEIFNLKGLRAGDD
jgi:uncharacterized membrane protein